MTNRRVFDRLLLAQSMAAPTTLLINDATRICESPFGITVGDSQGRQAVTV